jgi:hypothetical protein
MSPITFGAIGLAEPSTITKTVASVVIARNSTNDHQEILTLGDPQSSLGLARVLAAPPDSTEMGLAVRIVSGPSSLTSFLVRPAFSSTAADNPVSIPAGVLQANPPWSFSLDNIASSAGTFGNPGDPVNTSLKVTAVAGSLRVTQSSAADLLTLISGNSTVVQGTSPWIVGGNSTSRLNIGSTAADNAVLVSGNSTVAPLAGSTWNVRPVQSSQADLRITAYQSTAADLQATVTQASSLWQVQISNGNSSVTITTIAAGAGRINIGSTAADNTVLVTGNSTVAPLAGSTWATRPIQSSQADLRMTAYQSTAAEFLATVTIGANLQSTAAPSSASSGLIVRQVVDVLLTTASTNAFGASTTLTVQSSGALLRTYVTAYSITSTNAGPTKIAFFSSGVMLWPVRLAAVSSAVSGANLAVSPPGYLFRTIGAADGLTLQTGNAAVAGWMVGISYFRAP